MSFSISSHAPEPQLTDEQWKARASFGMEKDHADKLPAAAKAKLVALRDQLAEARAVIAVPREKLEAARSKLDAVEQRLDMLRRSNMTEAHPLVRAEIEVRDRLRAEHRAASDEYARRSEAVGPLGSMIRALESYVAALPAGVAMAPPTVPKLLKGEAAITGLSRIRNQIQALHDSIQAAIDAPIPSADVKRKMRAQVAAMAEAGRPSVANMVDFGEPFGFAEMASTIFGRTVSGESVTSDAAQFDAKSTFCWLFREQIIAALDREIDEAADDANALTDKERRERIAAAKKELLAAEREEEALIEMARATGLTIPRRDSADPRAILGLSDSAPAPRDD